MQVLPVLGYEKLVGDGAGKVPRRLPGKGLGPIRMSPTKAVHKMDGKADAKTPVVPSGRLQSTHPFLPIKMDTIHRLTDSWASSEWAPLAILTGVGGVVLWLLREIYIWKIQLRGIPGPFTNSLSCYYTLFTEGYGGRLHLWQNRELSKYGRVVRVGPTHVLTSDPNIARRVSALRSPYFKSPYYTIVGRMAPGADNTFSLGGRGNKERHYHQRTLLGPTVRPFLGA